GGKTAKILGEELDLHTVGDLLRHYPRRWEKRGELTDLSALEVGEFATIFASVAGVSSKGIRRDLYKTDVVVTDGTKKLTLTFFSKRDWQKGRFAVGDRAFFSGKVGEFNHKPQLLNPEVEAVDDDIDETASDFAGAILSIYPASKGATTLDIRRSMQVALDSVDLPDDPVPTGIRDGLRLLGYREALEGIHRPKTFAERDRARNRLAWDEAFVLQIVLGQRRVAASGLPATSRRPVDDGLLAAFDARLPFELTSGQRSIGELIAEEVAANHPMHRLLQGEVGSGKTVIALRAMLAVIDAGGQAALLAPTEVLAQQHLRSISDMLGDLALAGQLGGAETATTVTLLTGSLSQAARRKAMLDAASGVAGIVIGTHALLEDKVQFADLGLVVVDEQHKFGVEQRDALRAKARDDRRPHVLVMTATPIPRTVAMTVYGDLDVSTLTELPKGRAPITTAVAPVAGRRDWFDAVWQRVRDQVEAGHQAFVVCPRIGGDEPDEPDDSGEELKPDDTETDTLGFGATEGPPGGSRPAAPPMRPPVGVLELGPQLADGYLSNLRVEILHGRMPSDAKEATMRAFADGAVDVLVATTVIEVGVDVANATIMVIMDAERFGVSQLHQLRGRIGRGSAPSRCLLVTELPAGHPGRARLDAVAATSDGFELSELDLSLRREGTILGGQQHGRSDLKLLSLVRDRDLIGTAREQATRIVDTDPELVDHPPLAAAVKRLVATEDAEFLEKA
ncbi:MAG TPA: ATP-dependent DNA helicase RecG, partial [Acidothermaceae bacterium]|nr:ATP-dependent DNA helicase RecG [Acidothermaceae bacterium]